MAVNKALAKLRTDVRDVISYSYTHMIDNNEIVNGLLSLFVKLSTCTHMI